MEDLEDTIKKLASKIGEELYKTPEQKKKFEEALNNPDVLKKVAHVMGKINDAIKMK